MNSKVPVVQNGRILGYVTSVAHKQAEKLLGICPKFECREVAGKRVWCWTDK